VTSAATTATNPDNDSKNKLPERLLVVDDDRDTVRVLALSLLKRGFLVDAFSNPQDALQEIKSNPESYSLVLSDGWMPSISGLQLAKIVKDVNPNVKVLLLTGSEIRDDEVSDVSPHTNVDGVIQKPVSIGKLTDKILSLIGETKGRTYFKD
jgi:two-component system, cell cycle sensor histidine kinase and response regulator CckA